MKLTTEWLTEQQACQAGMDWFAHQTETDSIKVVRKLHTEKRNDWANWLIVRLMNRKQQLRYAINAAELALPWWEKQYPDDKSPRLAIEAARAVLANNTKETRAAARSAGWIAAWSATESAAGGADYAAYVGVSWSPLLEYGIELLESEEKHETNN